MPKENNQKQNEILKSLEQVIEVALAVKDGNEKEIQEIKDIFTEVSKELSKTMTPENLIKKFEEIVAITLAIKDGNEQEREEINNAFDDVMDKLSKVKADKIDGVADTLRVEIKKAIEDKMKLVKDGKDGKHGKDGKEGKKGKDGINGKNGKNGEKGVDGKTGKEGKKGEDGSPDNPEEIRDKLKTLEDEDRLGLSDLKGVNELKKEFDNRLNSLQIPRGGGGSGGIETYLNGSKIGSGAGLELAGSNTIRITGSNPDGHKTKYSIENYLSGFTPGSVLFTGASGEITEDPNNFFYTDATNILTVENIFANNSIDFDLLSNDGAFSRANMVVDLARVNEGAGITKGQPVYVNGVTGDKPQIGIASNLLHDKAHVLGLALDSGDNGDLIRVQTFGELRDVNTSTYSTGLLHLGDGILQNAVPSTGAHVHVGWATKINENTGIIEVEPDQYMHDIRATSDIDLEFAVGSNDATRKASFQGYDGTEFGYFDGLGDFAWDTDTLFVDASENRVGIGTSTPDSDLHIFNETAAANVRIETGLNGSNASFRLIQSGVTNPQHWNFQLQGDASGDAANRFVIKNVTAQTEPFTLEAGALDNSIYVDSVGVGIGTDTPLANVHLSAAAQTAMYFTEVGNGATYGFGSLGGFFKINSLASLHGGTDLSFMKMGLDIDINPGAADIDTIIRDDTAELARFNAGTHNLEFKDDKYISLGTTLDAKLGFDSANAQVLLDLTGVADTDLLIQTSGDDFNIEGSGGGIGIGIAASANTALKMVTTKRYGMTFNHTTSGVYPSTVGITSTFTGGTQGVGLRVGAVSSGSTALTDWLTGMNVLIQQRREADGTGMETSGMSFQVLNEVNSASAFDNGKMYGMNIEVGAGGGSYGAGIQTVPTAAGITARLIKNSKDSGTVIFTDWAAIYAPNASTWVGAGTFTITNGRGIWSEDQTDATNNTNLLLGDTGTTGNWSLYNNSAYNSLLLAGTTIGYIGDINSSIQDDGTDLIVTTDGDLQVACGTDKTLELQETVYDDWNVPAINLKPGASSPGFINILASGGIYGWAFDGNVTSEELHGSSEALHRYKEGTDIIPHVHWMPTTANAGDIKWFLEYSWVNVDGAFSAPTTISLVDTVSGTAWTHQIHSFAAISGTSKSINSHLVWRIYRDPTDVADTYAYDAVLLTVGFHYEVDTLGSRQLLVK